MKLALPTPGNYIAEQHVTDIRVVPLLLHLRDDIVLNTLVRLFASDDLIDNRAQAMNLAADRPSRVYVLIPWETQDIVQIGKSISKGVSSQSN